MRLSVPVDDRVVADRALYILIFYICTESLVEKTNVVQASPVETVHGHCHSLAVPCRRFVELVYAPPPHVLDHLVIETQEHDEFSQLG